MFRSPHRSLLVGLVALCQATARGGDDWPQWRGPQLNGRSEEVDWNPRAGTEPSWTCDIGLGHSSFAVVGDRVYTLGYDAETGHDVVYCIDANAGSVHWTYRYPCEVWDNAHDGGCLTTPTVVDEVVYTSNREGKALCLDARSGGLIWSRDLSKALDLTPPTWGFSASPLILGDQLFLNLGKVVALDASSGDTLWVTASDYGAAYSTPAPFEPGGETLLANLTGNGLTLVAAEDGVERAHFPWAKSEIYPMTPVVIGDRIFIAGGYGRGCALVQYQSGSLNELWSRRAMHNKMSGAVLYQDHLYGFDESILECLDLDGKVRWKQRGFGTGSMSIVDDKLVVLDGKGRLRIAEARPDGYVELSQRDLFDEGTFWSTPVLSHGRVYCRSSLGTLACLDLRRDTAAPRATNSEERALPTTEELFALHRAFLGDVDPDDLESVVMSGPGERLRNTVMKEQVEVAWSATQGFTWTAGQFVLGFDAERSWLLAVGAAPQLLEGEASDATREAGDLRRLLDPARGYDSFGEVTRASIDGRQCFALSASTPEGHDRVLYFDTETGAYCGHGGEGIALWTVSQWKQFGQLRLPTEWAFFHPDNGEMDSARFDSVVVNGEIAEGSLAIADVFAPLLRTAEEKEAENQRLRVAHAELLGRWTDPEYPDYHAEFFVDQGILQVREGERPATWVIALPDGSYTLLNEDAVRMVLKRVENQRTIDVLWEGEVYSTYQRGD